MGELSKHKAALNVASEATNKRGNKALGLSTRESSWCLQGPGQQQSLENLSAHVGPSKARARPELWISLPPAFALPATKCECSYVTEGTSLRWLIIPLQTYLSLNEKRK